MSALGDHALDPHFIGTAAVLLRYGDPALLADPDFPHRHRLGTSTPGPSAASLP
ncbi:hypothetical protein ACFCYX_24220 [Streptomyces populi]|uniref:hypothetical protein n=1 Tax=Streptomyces populi TaxID=2058924 RepID=UPI0013A6FD2B|nr:hypothetical protein [Streptomyces populi]